MYKVFKDNTYFILASSIDIPHISDAITLCIKEVSNIGNIIKKHSENDEQQKILILHKNIDALISAFENSFKIQEAAGGWVFNKENLLLINRLNHWDIAKGHLEKNESLEECAIREVEEETNVSGLKILRKLGISRHLFSHGTSEKLILKQTHWYEMTSNYDGKLIPQKDEGIEDVLWVKKDNIEEYLPKMWLSLKEFYLDNITDTKH